MRQTLHIFRKDARYLWPEICLVALLAALLAWVRPDWIEMVLLPAAGYLIARLIHAEAIPGDRQFWITRPYRWQSLLAAKLLFILVFVNLPVLLAQWWIVATGGFPFFSYLPGLLASQAAMILTLSLPVAALAALTPGIVSFIFSMLALAAIWYTATFTRIRNVGTIAPDSWPFGIGWLRAAFVGLLLAVIVIWILYEQYRRRKTLLNRAIGVVGLALLIAASFCLPWTAGWALQARLAKQKIDDSQVRISADPAAVRFQPLHAGSWSNVDVHIPIAVGPVPDGIQIETDDLSIQFEGADGAIWQSEVGGGRRGADNAGRMTLDINSKMSLAFFNRERAKPLSIHGSLYMTLFGNARQKTIPLREDPVNAMDGLQCYAGMWDDQLFCRSAFRWPAELVYGKLGAEMSPLRGVISYSPFPGSLRLNPIETSWAPSTKHPSEVTVVVKEPLAHICRDFELRAVRVITSNGPPPWR